MSNITLKILELIIHHITYTESGVMYKAFPQTSQGEQQQKNWRIPLQRRAPWSLKWVCVLFIVTLISLSAQSWLEVLNKELVQFSYFSTFLHKVNALQVRVIVTLNKKGTPQHPCWPHLSNNLVVVLMITFQIVGATAVFTEILTICEAVLLRAHYFQKSIARVIPTLQRKCFAAVAKGMLGTHQQGQRGMMLTKCQIVEAIHTQLLQCV